MSEDGASTVAGEPTALALSSRWRSTSFEVRVIQTIAAVLAVLFILAAVRAGAPDTSGATTSLPATQVNPGNG